MNNNHIIDKANQWLSSNITKTEQEEIKSLLNSDDKTQLEDAFYKNLEFGTGGLRGIMGIGSNRINKYTIGMATQGLANYLKKSFVNQTIKVAIAHDSRNNSSEFANYCASVFTANGIEVYFFESLRPTPELSFTIRHFGCQSGVVITASHNPREYNGYKVYWDDGAQITPPHDTNIINEVSNINSIDSVNSDKDESKIEFIGKEVDEIYLNEVKKLSLSPNAINNQKDLKIVYSSIHGSGITLVPQCLENFGFRNINIVEEQQEPNGDFPTVIYPNPEEEEAMTLALKKAQEIDADLVMATDPDADRVGIAVKNLNDEFELLNGNQTGALIIYYLLRKLTENATLPKDGYIVKTIVTTELIDEICNHFSVDCFDSLTGFKHIATIIRGLEGKQTYIGGGEESYGYMLGDFVRDKDAVSACAIIAEMTAFAKDEGKSLYEFMIDMYKQFGFYQENLISITKKGKSGSEEIAKMMSQFRNNPPLEINGSKVVKLYDYQSGLMTDLLKDTSEKLDFPTSNVLQFLTEDGSKISARPSGTEPKIKFYFSVKENLNNVSEYDETKKLLLNKIQKIKTDLKLV
ncbi:MAG: phospho-sugar mutase [Cyclobacteriaceae bacterium]|nr:phospho-sugar mutase [Cyclobacteriaceae bacterium]